MSLKSLVFLVFFDFSMVFLVFQPSVFDFFGFLCFSMVFLVFQHSVFDFFGFFGCFNVFCFFVTPPLGGRAAGLPPPASLALRGGSRPPGSWGRCEKRALLQALPPPPPIGAGQGGGEEGGGEEKGGGVKGEG